MECFCIEHGGGLTVDAGLYGGSPARVVRLRMLTPELLYDVANAGWIEGHKVELAAAEGAGEAIAGNGRLGQAPDAVAGYEALLGMHTREGRSAEKSAEMAARTLALEIEDAQKRLADVEKMKRGKDEGAAEFVERQEQAREAAEAELAMLQAIGAEAERRKGASEAEASYTASRHEAESEQLGYRLSDEVDDNGRQFVLNSEGSIEFGHIDASTGLSEAPILLSEGMITDKKPNGGYGLVHIEARHGDQIRANGYGSVLDFIEDVAKNWSVIKEGRDRNGNKTYRLIAVDKRNNTLMVELSADGSYWNINTAGIFKSSYGKNNKEIYSRHTTANRPAETGGESQGAEHSGTTDPSRMDSPISDISGGKGSGFASKKQESGGKSSGDFATVAAGPAAAAAAR